MRVRALEAGADLERLLTLWNDSVVPMLPQCHPITATELAHELGLAADEEASEDPGSATSGGFTEHVGDRVLEHRVIMVAEETAEEEEGGDTGAAAPLLGFVDCGVDPAHAGSGRQSLGSPPLNLPQRGMIRWLWFIPGQRAAGEALAVAAEAHLTQHGCEQSQVLAFDDEQTYHFYHVGHAFLSDRANHIHSLLEGRGYRRYECELFYAWENYEISELLPWSSTSAEGTLAGGQCQARRASIDELCPAGLTVSFESVPGRGQLPNGILYTFDARMTVSHSIFGAPAGMFLRAIACGGCRRVHSAAGVIDLFSAAGVDEGETEKGARSKLQYKFKMKAIFVSFSY